MEATTLTFADVLNEASPAAAETLTKEFTAKGKTFKVTIKRDALTDADEFYKLCSLSAKYGPDATEPVEPISVAYPPSMGKNFTITNPMYIGALDLLSRIAIDPPFQIEQWAMVGDKFGPQFISKISGWAATENGLVDQQKTKEQLDPKGKTPGTKE